MIFGASTNDAINMITCLFGIRELFEHKHSNPFTSHIPIGRRRERFAASIFREHTSPSVTHMQFGRDQSIDPTNDGHAALATLDGRDPAIEAGHNFRGCERYALPRAWTSFLAGSENRGLGLRLRDSHLQIWHEQGFLLLDALFAGEVTQNIIQRQLSECREDYVLMDRAALRKVLSGTGFAGCGPLSVTPAREFHRFLAFLMPYIRWRLASNLGLNSARSSVIRDVLLLRSAHLYVTATHIDLVMSMNQASGPVRLAGLDADPGWLPSFGRVVKFHFI